MGNAPDAETDARGEEPVEPAPTARVSGAAILITGAGLPTEAAGAVEISFGGLKAVLQAAREPWVLRRIAPASDAWFAPSRAGLRRYLDELAKQEVATAAVVVAGMVTSVRGVPSLVTGPHHAQFPDDATLPLAAFAEALAAARARGALMVLLGWPVDGDSGRPADWLQPLRSASESELIVVSDLRAQPPLLDELTAALASDALDPATGTVTTSSLAAHLSLVVPQAVIVAPAASRTVIRPPVRGTLPALVPQRPRPPALIDLDDLSGTTLSGELRLEAMVARGGFGTVYRAHHLALGRRVAVKILHAGIDPDSDEALLFRQEIRAIAQLKHPHVVYVHHADVTADGRLFFEMELLEGPTLQQVVERDGPLPRPRAIVLVCQLLSALAAVHDAGIIHADVKPSNVVVVGASGDERAVLIDFGMSRLRLPDGPAESAGGTRAYMAPEQINKWRVDTRSDIYATGLVLLRLLTGWQRQPGDLAPPPIEQVDDPALRAALGRALATQPDDRFGSAGELASAIGGGALPDAAPPVPPPPFRYLKPFTERDRGRLHGRDRDVVDLIRALDVGGAIICTAPSGTGKTSVLRAGLVPYLEVLGTRALYWECVEAGGAELAAAIWPGSTDVAMAIERWYSAHGRRLVVILDQVERLLGVGTDDAANELLAPLLSFERHPAGAEVAVILGVREDFVARLRAALRRGERGVVQVRLPPLRREQARSAIVRPLAEHRLTIAPALLDDLLDDLSQAGAQLGAALGWGVTDAVYPPHLQLACLVLYRALGPLEATLTQDHYRAAGGLRAIVGEHLRQAMNALTSADAEVAREVLLGLVTSPHARKVRAQADLLELAQRFEAARVNAVLRALCDEGLLVSFRHRSGEDMWALVHDSLEAVIKAWLDVHDLDRRRAAEMIRHQLRQSEERTSLLVRSQLDLVAQHAGLVDELEAEWGDRPGATLTPRTLVARSRRAAARRRAIAIGVGATVLAVTVVLLYYWDRERALRREEASLHDRNLGRISLELRAYDWDPARQLATDVDVDALPALSWALHDPRSDDSNAPGPVVSPDRFRRRASVVRNGVLVQDAEARAGEAIMVVRGRARPGEPDCGPSIVPIRRLPGYAQRHTPRVIRVRVPTCRASEAGMVEIPAGRFVSGGVGEPPSSYPASELPTEAVVDLPAFRIDRTEVTNAAFQPFAAMSEHTGIWVATYPDQLAMARGPSHPRTDVNAVDALAYCRFLGKRLPTSAEWQKSVRGGLTLADGTPNPMPKRSFPWGAPITPPPANLKDVGLGVPAAVDAFPGDVSPDGVVGLAGNVQEWTSTFGPDPPGTPLAARTRITRGANWNDARAMDLADRMATENPRSPRKVDYYHGVRCAASPAAAVSPIAGTEATVGTEDSAGQAH